MTVSGVIRNFSDSDAFGTGSTTDVFDYFGWNDDVPGEWERGTGHMSDAATLVRDTVLASSNSGAAVDWSAGTKHLTNDIPAAKQLYLDASNNLTVPGTITQDGNAVLDASDIGSKVQSYDGAVNLKDWGAKGDGITKTDGAITSGDNTLTSASSSFSSADVGKAILVTRAGTAGALLVTTIASINSGTSIELTDAASTTVSSSGRFVYGTDDTASINDAFAALVSGRAVLPFGDYVVTDTIQLLHKNDANNQGMRNLEISAYGAKITTSVAAGETAFLLDDVKNLTLRGLEIFGENYPDFNIEGAWCCRFVDLRATTLPLNFSKLNLPETTFDINLWLKFDNCEFRCLGMYTGPTAGDSLDLNATYFDACRIGTARANMTVTAPDYLISVYGSRGPRGVHFMNCDLSYYGVAMFYIDEQVDAGAGINIYGGYMDSALIGTPVDLKGLVINFRGGVVAHSTPKYFDTAVADVGSQQVLDFSWGDRNGSRYPVSSSNLFKNGDLRYGLRDITYNSTVDLTKTVETGAGVYGKFARFVTSANRGINFSSIDLPFDGVYSIVLMIRNRGDALTGSLYDGVGTAIAYNALDIPGAIDEWVIASVITPVISSGTSIRLQLTGVDSYNLDFDIAYVGLTYGRIAPLLSLPPPDTNMWKVLAHDAAGWSHTGDTSETALVNVKIPGGYLGANGMVRITTLWTGTSSANNKSMKVRHAASSGVTGNTYTSVSTTTSATSKYQTEFHNRNSVSSQVGGLSAGTGGWGTTSLGLISGTVDTSADSYINITGQLANGGETLTLEAYTVEVLYQS